MNCLATIALLTGLALVGDNPLVGTWRGQLKQPGVGDFSVVIDADRRTIDYPSLGCGGTLILRGQSGWRYTFRESITRGASKCLDNGTVVITVRDATSASFTWSLAGRSETASGIVYGKARIPQKPPEAGGVKASFIPRYQGGQYYYYMHFTNPHPYSVRVSGWYDSAPFGVVVPAGSNESPGTGEVSLGTTRRDPAKIRWSWKKV